MNSISEQQSLKAVAWPAFPQLSMINQAYWFRLILSEEESQLELRYKVWIRFVKRHTNKSALLSIDRISDILINDEIPDLAADQLAYETGKIFYPLIIEISQRAQYLGVHNFEQIAERWQKLRPEIVRRFSGVEAERYFTRMNEVVASKAAVDELFRNDLLLTFCFNTVYLDYAEEPVDKKKLCFPVGDYAPVTYDVSVSKCRNAKGFKEIVQEGREVKSEGADSLHPDKSDKENTYAATFVLDTATNCILEATAEWDFKQPHKKNISLILFPLRVQPDNSMDFVRNEEENKKGRGFFSTLFGS